MQASESQVSWLLEATGGLITSIQHLSNRFGVFAERLDEIGAEVLRNVDLPEESSVSPSSIERQSPNEIIHANGDVTEVVGMNSLPVEVLHLIILHLNEDLNELGTVSSVCRTWYFLSRDCQVWNEMYARHEHKWTFLHGPMIGTSAQSDMSLSHQHAATQGSAVWFTPKSLLFNDFTVGLFAAVDEYRSLMLGSDAPSSYLSGTMDITTHNYSGKWWIRRFLKQHFWNVRSRSNEPISLPNPSKLLNKIRVTPVVTLPVFGPGVGSAQKAIYDFVGCVVNAVSMHAGVLGIGTGIGVNIKGTIYKLASIHRPPEPFHEIAVADDSWRTLFRSAAVYVYAVSARLSMEETRADLESFLRLDFGSNAQSTRQTPILVLSFVPSRCAAEIAQSLGLFDLPPTRIWGVKVVHDEHRSRDLLFALHWIQSIVV